MTPSSADLETQQIQSKLGDFAVIKHLLEEPKRLIGVEGVPASPVTANGTSRTNSQQPEFKKPSHGSSSSSSSSSNRPPHHSSSHQRERGGFVKPADGKPPYEGRGGYPGQPVKHGGGNHRSNGIVPPKGPPPPSSHSSAITSSSSSLSRIHNASRNLPRLHVDQV